MKTDLMDHVYAVIMAGGGGTRLWPISRRKNPKHILPLLGEATLFQSTVRRLDGLIPTRRILVVTTDEQAAHLRGQAPGIPEENFLLEPQPRGTAAAIGLAGMILQRRDPHAIMMVLPSDHFIRNEDVFRLVMRAAVQVALEGPLVTLGVKPSFPSTGYGYIQQGAHLDGNFNYPVYRVLRFTEKPDEASARQMLAAGDHSWNAGIFIWQTGRILEEIARLLPDLSTALEKINRAWETPQRGRVLSDEWSQLKAITIDYGVMEHARDVAVLPASGLEWNDVGSWDSLFDVLLADEHGNVVINSDHLSMETHDTLVYSSGNKFIVTIGVDDLAIIDAGDALLICHRDQTQEVRKVIGQLEKTKRERYL